MKLKTKIEKILDDYHIRGYTLENDKMNKICAENKKIDVDQILNLIKEEVNRNANKARKTYGTE